MMTNWWMGRRGRDQSSCQKFSPWQPHFSPPPISNHYHHAIKPVELCGVTCKMFFSHKGSDLILGILVIEGTNLLRQTTRYRGRIRKETTCKISPFLFHSSRDCGERRATMKMLSLLPGDSCHQEYATAPFDRLTVTI